MGMILKMMARVHSNNRPKKDKNNKIMMMITSLEVIRIYQRDNLMTLMVNSKVNLMISKKEMNKKFHKKKTLRTFSIK
jgi:hypothetical protein